MGFKTGGRLIYIIVCLLIAGGFVHFRPYPEANLSREKLSEVLSRFGGWESVDEIGMQENLITALELDDYLFRSYKKNGIVVTLYVGYYYTTSKIGAAHSPLVCFPGQGWEVSAPQNATIKTTAGTIRAEEMIVKKGRQQELLIYWFQSYDMTSSGTFLQKVNNFHARLNSDPEDNAFVRVSISVQDNQTQPASQAAMAFVQDFYPVFLNYIKS